MKASICRYSFVFSFLFLACNPEDENQNSNSSGSLKDISTEEQKTTILSPEISREEKITTTTKHFSISRKKNTDNLTQVTYSVRQDLIDSLNDIAPIYDATKYHDLAISYFTTLADNLNGKTFFAENPDSLVEVIIEILSTRIEDGTDIVFLIDKTGSMDDDILKVQTSLTLIMDYLEKFQNVRLGVAAYGDKNWHHDFWYNSIDLSYDISEIRKFMKSFETIGNPDTPESVNDAIVNTVKNMSWVEGNRKLLLVIGDAPSQVPPYSEYSINEVIKYCSDANVLFNLYPIIIATDQSYREPFIKQNFAKIYPNPVNQILTIKFQEEGAYFYTLHDQSGRVIKSAELTGNSATINFNEIINGLYLIQIYGEDEEKYFSQQIIVQR